MNLTPVTQALSGGVAVVSDPLRDREFKRARKQISDGIQGLAFGAAIIVGAVASYLLIPHETWVYVLSLVMALAGIVKLFRSIGTIVDARVGPKLLDPALQSRVTGSLVAGGTGPVNVRPSGRLSETPSRPPAQTRLVGAAGNAERPLAERPLAERTPPGEAVPRQGTGRINRELSTPLRRLEQDDDLMSLLRN
jgi:hypothetical protein